MTVNATRPSLDPRYAVGLCGRCSSAPGTADGLDHAKVQQLVRSDAFDPKLLEERRRQRRERRIIRKPRLGEEQEAQRILGRYEADAAAREASS